MDSDFWHKKWEDNQIGFHRSSVNPLLVRFLSVLGLVPGARVFLPLCGKTRDIAWLRDQGFRVAGAELSRLAIEQLFDELGETPEITEHGALTRFSGEGIDIFVGDIFELSAPVLGPVDAIYDRAALVALPGVGTWTAEIYLKFALGRADVLAAGDLALQEAARMLYGLEARPGPAALRAIARHQKQRVRRELSQLAGLIRARRARHQHQAGPFARPLQALDRRGERLNDACIEWGALKIFRLKIG